MFAAAERQDGVAEAVPGLGDLAGVVESGVFKRAEGVGAEDFGPLVAVIAGGIATREDVRETAQKTIFGQRRQHRRRARDAALHIENRLGASGLVAMVQL